MQYSVSIHGPRYDGLPIHLSHSEWTVCAECGVSVVGLMVVYVPGRDQRNDWGGDWGDCCSEACADALGSRRAPHHLHHTPNSADTPQATFAWGTHTVKPNKIDGAFLPSVSGKPEVWNWRPEHATRSTSA